MDYRFGRAAEALKTLEKNELATNNTNSNVSHTTVLIIKSLDELEIYIPTKKNAIQLVFEGGTLSLFLWLLLMLNTGGAVSVLVGWVSFIISTLIITWLILPGFVENNICFNNKKFEIRWELFGMTLKKQRGNISEIDKVYISRTGGIGRKKLPEIILAVGVNEYFFGRFKTGLTEEESQCVASEIRDWLGI